MTDKQIVRSQGDIEDPWINRNDLVASLRNMASTSTVDRKWVYNNLADRLEKLEYLDD